MVGTKYRNKGVHLLSNLSFCISYRNGDRALSHMGITCALPQSKPGIQSSGMPFPFLFQHLGRLENLEWIRLKKKTKINVEVLSGAGVPQPGKGLAGRVR